MKTAIYSYRGRTANLKRVGHSSALDHYELHEHDTDRKAELTVLPGHNPTRLAMTILREWWSGTEQAA